MDYGLPLRFGVFVTPVAEPVTRPVELAELAEELGYDLVTVQDHPYNPGLTDAWTLLSWIAARTERVTVAGNVLNLPLRPPAVLARAAAALDRLSGGRVAMGLGAGAFWDGIESMGGPRRTPGEAVAGVREAIEVFHGLWADEGALDQDGRVYRHLGTAAGPRPAHDIPIWLGALGPRMLDLVGAAADGWLPSYGYLKPGQLAAGMARIDAAARAAGRDPREITRLLNINGAFTASRRGELQGPPAAWVEDLLPLAVEHGVSTFILASDDPETMALFAREVAPALREAVRAHRDTHGTMPGAVVPAAQLRARREGIDYDGVPAGVEAIAPGESAFGGVRHTYMYGGDPGLVLLPRDQDQAAAALAFARAQDAPLTVRSGGHGISGRSTNDGGIVLDLRRLDAVEIVNEDERLVRVGAGARWGDVADALAERGWAITSGDSGGVGVGGLGSTGGIGLLGRAYGLTIDHMTSVRVLLADGRVVEADDESEPDLFWGMRGAGSALGIALSFVFRADVVGDVGIAQLVFDAGELEELLPAWGAAVTAAPERLTSFLTLGAPRGGRSSAYTISVVDSADPDEILADLQPFAQAAPLLDQAIQVASYAALVRAPETREHQGQGAPVARSVMMGELTSAFARDVATLLASGATYFFQIRATGGATARVPAEDTAYWNRWADFSVVAFGSSDALLDRYWEPVAAHGHGAYPSFDTRHGRAQLEADFGGNLPRLRALKARLDPEDVFSTNFPLAPEDAT